MNGGVNILTIRTMRRLRLPVRAVHAGHDRRPRALIELVDRYLARRDPGYAAPAA
jgi:hypothetical protein